jgi:release factor glutamine methyltransferase
MAEKRGPKAGRTKAPLSISACPSDRRNCHKKARKGAKQSIFVSFRAFLWQFQSVTVLEVIQRSADFLSRKGVDSPRLQAELLLAHVLQLPRLKLYLQFERCLSDQEVDCLRTLVKRRGEREPLQHILGSTSFCGIEIAVNPDVLVPRPETEILAETAWEYLKKRGGEPVVLDYGTGSGCIAIALAAHCPSAKIHALDISEKALAVARTNAVSHNITFHLGKAFPELPPLDLLVSNPPYIPSGEIASLQPEVARFDPHLALDGGGDGLDFYRRIAAEALPLMAPDGCVMLEFGDGQESAQQEIFARDWIIDQIKADFSGKPRILIAHRAKT